MKPIDVEQYRALVEYLPTMVWRSHGDGRRDYFNATWLAFTGRSLEQELGQGWLEGIHPDDLASCGASYLEYFRLRQPFEIEFRLRRFDGAYRYISDRGVPYGAADSLGGFVGSCVDIDERRVREASSGESDFFGMSLDNLCVAGFDGYFKQVNQSWTRTLGWTAEELLSKPSLEFVHPADREATMAGRRLLHVGSALGPLVNRYLCKDGSYRWFEWRSIGHHERGLVYAAARDITEQKLGELRLAEANEREEKLRRQLLFADRMASVGTLAAGAAHELNNPLAYVSGNIAMMLEELESGGDEPASGKLAELTTMAREAQVGVERMRKIVLGLKTFSRAEQEQRTVIDVRPLLDLAVEMASHDIRRRAELVRDYSAVPLIDGDEARLGQVFINLLVNAVQALPEDSAAHEIRVVTSTDAMGRAVIEVRDTGTGIPAELLGRIFDPFFTTKLVGIGTGLGLFICHNVVTSMGGEIAVTSELGRGTTFRVVLPPATNQPNVAATSLATSGASYAGVRVLVVDDEPAIGIVLRRVLRGHEVTSVTSAKHALELMEEGKNYDVILSDLMMPEMSGMGFYEALMQRFPDAVARIVFISGGASTPSAKAFFERIPNQVIAKPFDPQRVRDAVQRVAESWRSIGAG